MENVALPKFCVFCGKKPDSKTNEHVIPQWLIKLTGNPNRSVNLGVDTQTLRKTGEFKLRSYSFKSFKFPACKVCNEEFSDLESKAQAVVLKILSSEYLNEKEIDLFLDWLDKIRIRLWLANLLLDREIAPVDPKFHIKSRIGKKDRGVYVYEIENDQQSGIQFTASNSPSFLFSPSCFSLCINNYHFFNFSFDFLFSRNIGFPYPINSKMMPNDRRTISEFTTGTEKIKHPLIKGNFADPSIKIYQPIFPFELNEDSDDVFNKKYVKDNSLNYRKGKGSIFFEEGNKLSKLTEDEEIKLTYEAKTYNRKFLSNLIAKQATKMQLDLCQRIDSPEDLPEVDQKEINRRVKSVVKMQKKWMTLLK